MAVFKDPDKLAAHIKKAMDALQAETLITAQARLGSAAVSPIQSGRLRSSWFASEGPGTGAVAPEGTNSPNTDATGLKVDSRKTYTLQNALPYSQYICLEGKAVSKPANWFVDFVNADIPKIQAKAAQQIKREFDL